MNTTKKMEANMALLLTIGTLISAILVIFGGILYLVQHGHEPVHFELLKDNTYQLSVKKIWHTAEAFSTLTIIELGLLLLVATQLFRVGLLTWFYLKIRDYWFTAISFFILLVLIYSFIWRN